LPWGNATFLQAILTLFAWLASVAARLATVYGHADFKPPDQPAPI
jgi:hypothetical protein